MDITSLNEQILAAGPGEMTLHSFEGRDRRLVLTFTCDGGPREDDVFCIEFRHAILFHVPSVLRASVRFRFAGEAERMQLIPWASYDADEVSGEAGAYTVVALDDAEGTPYGYYVAAESAAAYWRRRVDT